MLIGELEGEVSTERLKFEAYKDVKMFDFVTVKNPKEGKEWILAQIDSVKKFPDGKTACEANIIGYREKGMLKRPRHVVKPDSMVYRADEAVIAETLGLEQDGGLYMGRLETNPDIRIFLNPEDLYKHLAVLAKTGAGKSYATSVLVEELLEKNYPVIVIDPHGEYHSLAVENEIDEQDMDRYNIEPTAYDIVQYSTNTAVNPGVTPLSFSSEGLDAKEIQQIVPTNLTNSQLEVLYNTLKELKQRDAYTLGDVINAAMDQESKAKWNLVNILEVVHDSNLFSDDPTDLEDLVQRGTASVITMKGVDPEKQEMIVYKLAKELFEKRKIGELEPFIMIIEEAHNFVPERNFGKAVCSDILRTIASEGRKFGLGIGVISQRPARVDKNILSQCNTQLIMRVTNPNDLNAISRSFEGVTSEVRNYITSLPPGVGLVLGKEYPVMTDIRTRRSKHGGETSQLSDDDGDTDRTETVAASQDRTDNTPESAQDETVTPEPSSPATVAMPEPAADTSSHNDTDQNTARPEERPVETDTVLTAITPSIDPDGLRDEYGDVKTAYYPIWIVANDKEQVAVDGTDGEVKGVLPQLNQAEEGVLAEIGDESKTRGNLLQALDMSLPKLERALDQLQDHGLIAEDGDAFERTTAIFEQAREDVGEGDYTKISTSISEEKAVSIARDHLDGAPDTVEKVYYPYFTAGRRVFDGVNGEEI